MIKRPDDRVRVRTTELIGKGWASLTRYVVQVRRRDGETHEIVRDIEDHGNAVAVLPTDPERGTILLTRQFRLAAHLSGHDGWLVEACAGIIDAGETAEAAAIREVREEMGVALTDIRQIREIFLSPGVSMERATLFSARYGPADRVAEGGGVDEGEDIEVFEMKLADAAAALADGSIVDAKTVILIQAALLAERPPRGWL